VLAEWTPCLNITITITITQLKYLQMATLQMDSILKIIVLFTILLTLTTSSGNSNKFRRLLEPIADTGKYRAKSNYFGKESIFEGISP